MTDEDWSKVEKFKFQRNGLIIFFALACIFMVLLYDKNRKDATKQSESPYQECLLIQVFGTTTPDDKSRVAILTSPRATELIENSRLMCDYLNPQVKPSEEINWQGY